MGVREEGMVVAAWVEVRAVARVGVARAAGRVVVPAPDRTMRQATWWSCTNGPVVYSPRMGKSARGRTPNPSLETVEPWIEDDLCFLTSERRTVESFVLEQTLYP